MTGPGDPLGRDLHGHLSVTLPVLGIAVTFETNARWILERFPAVFGDSRIAETGDGLAPPPPLRVRVLEDRNYPARAIRSPTARLPDAQRLVLVHPLGVGLADAERGDAMAYVAPELGRRPDDLDEVFVGTLTLFLVTRFDRHPLHAAAVTEGDAAVVLAGPSGVGKSTLAYALWRAGVNVLSDDAVYVQLEPLGLWGTRTRLHLPLDAPGHYPELAAAPRVRRAAGDQKIVVSLRRAAGPDAAPVARRVGVCLLRRSEGTVWAEPVAPDEAVAELARRLEVGFDRFSATVKAAAARITAGGSWVLHLAAPPTRAVPLVQDMLAAVRRS